MTDYKYDIAISLCKQDVDFARKLVKALNPGLKVFFYEDRQEDLISKSGPEAFARVFKEEARVVLILSRDEWGDSYYTEIEKNAIIDRTAIKNQGYQFLVVMPMEPGQIPSWYPSTRIYLNPARFKIEELASFIEFKITEEGGVVIPVTVKQRYENLVSRIKAKQEIIYLQADKEAIKAGNEELGKLSQAFNKKMDALSEQQIYQTIRMHFLQTSLKAQFGIGRYLIQCEINLPYYFSNSVVTTQDIVVVFQLYQINGTVYNLTPLPETETRIFYYDKQNHGWGLPEIVKKPGNAEKQLLFHLRNNTTEYYELKNIISSEEWVDKWFQLLLTKSTSNLEQYLT